MTIKCIEYNSNKNKNKHKKKRMKKQLVLFAVIRLCFFVQVSFQCFLRRIHIHPISAAACLEVVLCGAVGMRREGEGVIEKNE